MMDPSWGSGTRTRSSDCPPHGAASSTPSKCPNVAGRRKSVCAVTMEDRLRSRVCGHGVRVFVDGLAAVQVSNTLSWTHRIRSEGIEGGAPLTLSRNCRIGAPSFTLLELYRSEDFHHLHHHVHRQVESWGRSWDVNREFFQAIRRLKVLEGAPRTALKRSWSPVH